MLGSSKMLFFCLLSTTDAGLWIALPKEASLTWQLAPFCDQAEENIQHILLTSCEFARQVWTLIFQKFKLYAARATESTSCFYGWWYRTLTSVPNQVNTSSRHVCLQGRSGP